MTAGEPSTRTFPAERASVTTARRFASEALDSAPSEVSEAVELMVSELATNVIKHVRSAFEVSVFSNDEEIMVGVSDPSSVHPTLRSPTPDEPTGRGLRIVELLADAWGVSPNGPDGKTVWFTVRFPVPVGG